jgi:hypothetical protein
MASKFRGASLYWNGRRVASATSGSYTPTMAGEDVITEDGFQDVSDGAWTTDIQIERATPIVGDGFAFNLGDRGTVTLYPVNGKTVTLKPAVVMESPQSWDNRTGTMTGTVRFHGGKAKLS